MQTMRVGANAMMRDRRPGAPRTIDIEDIGAAQNRNSAAAFRSKRSFFSAMRDPDDPDSGFGAGDDEHDAERSDKRAGGFRQDNAASVLEEAATRDALDEKMGFVRFTEGPERLGWLINVQPTTLRDNECPTGRAGVDLYFLEEDGASFKATIFHNPYFYVICKPGTQIDVLENLRRRFSRTLASISHVVLDDLELPNHITVNKRTLIKLSFWNVQQLVSAKRLLQPIAERNAAAAASAGISLDSLFVNAPSAGGSGAGDFTMQAETASSAQSGRRGLASAQDGLENIVGLREYDITYYTRVAIDCDIRVGLWYTVSAGADGISLEQRPERIQRADPVILAFDIETTKLPLKFPDAETDSIMMISYMIDSQGFLITNRSIVSQDIDDFEFTPKPEFEGHFTIFNEPDERSLIQRFIDHIHAAQPTVFVTYNGDFFDWPFVEKRAAVHGIQLSSEIGFSRISGGSAGGDSGEYTSRHAIHMDCFAWVKRDSYLPQGSQGLKAVAKYKLGYNPIEVDPEDMTRFAMEQPQTLAQYSVSDAVATYYLYMKYVHPFIFSLCNIIPMNPDDVLRRGSGTLCETLLMVQAYKSHVVMPNKHVDALNRTFEGHLLSSETYVGGHVEALEAGVFRSDLPTQFRLDPTAFDQLISEVDQALEFSITVENKMKMEDISNYDEVRSMIVSQLQALHDTPVRMEEPLIYHLDVAAMYPNIILTNRLQPNAVIDEAMCAMCDYNEGPESSCQRRMTWSWRGEYFPATRGEVNMIQNQLEQERFRMTKTNQVDESGTNSGGTDITRSYHDLPLSEQSNLLRKRVAEYSRKVYSRLHENKVIERESIVCQREHPFYVNTVRAFRDRRYEYKSLLKTAKKQLDTAQANSDHGGISESKRMIVIYDSLQLAHKCILNSFYGYVMRKGARWFSMSMAGIVCLTGARIIQLARSRVERIGRPLELDTDGIWCVLPKSFPETFTFEIRGSGKTMSISYPCVMLNHLVHDQFTNHQYQDDDGKGNYTVRSENSIFFEVDGPYRAMILPASTEEDRLLKKRYAVFNHDGTLAELKGFEIKRRGELGLIKNFQSSIFKVFLDGNTLESCYTNVGDVANRWLDMLYSRGMDIPDAELFDLISENRSMSKSLKEYGAQKSTSISTAKRLAEFLGDQMVRDKGLACKFVISAKPNGVPVSERAIPIAIFQAEPAIRRHFLRQWLRDPSVDEMVDVRDILDWSYYIQRFGSVIQKLITIPAAMQMVDNPVPRVEHPDWLSRRVMQQNDKYKQKRITDMFGKVDTDVYRDTVMNETRRMDGDLNANDNSDELRDDEVPDCLKPDVMGPNVYMHDYSTWIKHACDRYKLRRRMVTRGALLPTTVTRSKRGNTSKRSAKAPSDPPLTSRLIRYAEKAFAELYGHDDKPKRRLGSFMPGMFGSITIQGPKFLTPTGAVDDTVYGNTSAQTAATASGMKLYRSVTQDAATAIHGIHVLEIFETDIPGSFILWVLTPSPSIYASRSSQIPVSGIQQIRVTVPRRFYIECKGRGGGFGDMDGEIPSHPLIQITKTRKLVPRMTHGSSDAVTQPSNNGSVISGIGSRSKQNGGDNGQSGTPLYQLEMPEQVYQTHQTMITSLFNHPDVTGIYETHVPSLFRAILKIGCVSKVMRKSGGGGLPSAIDLTDIDREAHGMGGMTGYDARCMYLSGCVSQTPPSLSSSSSSSMYPTRCRFMYMFHATNGTDTRQVYGIFIPHVKSCHIVVIDPGNNRDAIPNVTRMIHEMVSRYNESQESQSTEDGVKSQGVFEYTADMDVTTTVRHDVDQAHQAINNVIRDYISQRHGATILALQSPRSRRYLMTSGITMLREVPVVSVPYHGPDSGPTSPLFPALGWQPRVITRMVSHYMNVSVFLGDRIQLSWYSDIPICNLVGDYTMFVSDVGLGRWLNGHDAVMWYSENGVPDTGTGLDDAMSRYIGSSTAGGSTGGVDDVQGMVMPNEVNRVGSYSNVCVELDIWDLVLNTVLQSNVGMETDMMFGKRQPAQSNNGQDNNTLVTHDWIDKTQFPPQLYTLFRHLIQMWTRDMTKYGNSYASHILDHLTRWLVSPVSKFHNPMLLSTIQSTTRHVFMGLIRHVQRVGCSVVHASMDKIVVCTNKTEVKNAMGYMKFVVASLGKVGMFEHVDVRVGRVWRYLVWMDVYNWAGVQDAGDGGVEVDMKWSMIESLPQTHQHTFMRFMTELLEAAVPNGTGDGESASKRIERLLEASMRKQLMSAVQTMKKMTLREMNMDVDVAEADPAARDVSKVGGWQRKKGDPTLEFVKMMCAVLSMEVGLEGKVRSLRRDLLAMVGVNEFSDKAVFVMGNRPLVLRQVICEYCSLCRDVDLSRERVDKDGSRGFWACTACHMEYDVVLFEQMLVDMVVKRVVGWQMQDVRCAECGFVMAEDLRGHCVRCMGRLECAMSRKDLLVVLEQMEAIAEEQEMEMLQEALQFAKG